MIEGHPVQVANRCVAAIALAPPGSKSAYGLGDNHVAGFLARGDIIHMTFPSGWGPDIDVPIAHSADSAVAASFFPPLTAFKYGYATHSVVDTYLRGAIGSLVSQQLSAFHRECVMVTANLSLGASTVPVGSTFSAVFDIRNENNRSLQGRKVTLGFNAYLFQKVDSLTLRAMVPRANPQEISADVDKRLFPQAQMQVPFVSVQAGYSETLSDGGWHVVYSSNGDQNSPPPTSPPESGWDGGEASCTARVRKASAGTAFQEWQLVFCSRS